MARMIGPASSVYQAYDGPATGGFNVLPQSAVPDLGVTDEQRRYLLGDDGALVHPMVLAAEPLPADLVPQQKRGPRMVGPANPQQQRSMIARTTIMPKGGKSEDVLANEAREIYRELTQPRPLASDRSYAGNILQSHVTEVGDAILAAPSVVGDFLTFPARKLMDKDAPWFGALPRTSAAKIMSHVPTSADDNRTPEERLQDIEMAEAERRARYPVSSTIGDLTGVAQELALGRAPFSKGLRRREVAVEKKIERGTPMSQKVMYNRADWKKALDNSVGWNSFQKVMGRTVESGVEGATIALLDGGDPLETAAYTAGAQGVFGGALQAAQHKFLPFPKAGRVANLAINSAILSGLFYTIDTALPGEARDYEASKAAAQKVLWGYALGAAAGAVSARSRSGMVSAAAPGKSGPHVMDALSSAPRNMMQSVIADYVNSDEGARAGLRDKLTKFYNNIENLSESDLRAVTAAFNADKERFYRELDRVTGGLQ